MITKGSKIQLVKPMGVFDKVGEICEVVKVNEDAVITFMCTIGMGCMSYDELDKYFKVRDEEVKKETEKLKRKWSNWKYDTFIYYDFNGDRCTVPVKYRNNGKIVDLRTDWDCEDNMRTKASCSKNDVFNLDTGLDLADYRMQIKFMQKELKDMIDEMY